MLPHVKIWMVMNVEINEDLLRNDLIYSEPIKYSEKITLYPVKMKDVFKFQQLSTSITIRKNSIFLDKNILKMTYLDFLFYCHNNKELANNYKLPFLPYVYQFAYELLKLVCAGQNISVGNNKGAFMINDEVITPEIFDDLRRIIIIQNDMDFDIDEFINYDTEQELMKAQSILEDQNKEKSTIEDYIDSLVIALKYTDEEIKNLTIRKFWRYINRINMYDSYKMCQTGAMSGMITFKDPIKHWMTIIEKKDKYEDVKTSEDEIKNKVG